MERKESARERRSKVSITEEKRNPNNFPIIEKADNGIYEEAINGFDEIIRLNPKDEGSYFARATLKVRLGDIEGARQGFRMSELCRRKDDAASKYYPLV